MGRLGEADCSGRGTTEDCGAKRRWFAAQAAKLWVNHGPPEPVLLGRHLIADGMTPGPAMGQVLKTVYERQLDGKVRTLDEARELAGSLRKNSLTGAQPLVRGRA